MFAVICTAKVNASLLSRTLAASYTAPDCEPSLVLLLMESELYSPTFGETPSFPPLTEISAYPFLSASHNTLATLLRQADNENISNCIFLAADEQTLQDRSLLLVHREEGEQLQTVRVGEEWCNSQAIGLEVGTTGVGEMVALRDVDGVYRGGRGGREGRKGGEAERKRLQGPL